MAYLSPASYACARLLGDAGDETLATPEAQGARIRLGLERTAAAVGPIARLEDVIEGVEPWDPRVRIVEHPHAAAYALFGVPAWIGQEAECGKMVARKGQSAAEGEDESYGRYFATAFRFETAAGEPAMLYLGWEKQQDAWRIFAFKVEEP
jgi:hypothetical protein